MSPSKRSFRQALDNTVNQGDGGKCDGLNRIQLSLALGVSPANHNLPLKIPSKGTHSRFLAQSGLQA
jgi:hypothetical protein